MEITTKFTVVGTRFFPSCDVIKHVPRVCTYTYEKSLWILLPISFRIVKQILATNEQMFLGPKRSLAFRDEWSLLGKTKWKRRRNPKSGRKWNLREHGDQSEVGDVDEGRYQGEDLRPRLPLSTPTSEIIVYNWSLKKSPKLSESSPVRAGSTGRSQGWHPRPVAGKISQSPRPDGEGFSVKDATSSRTQKRWRIFVD